MADTLTIGQFDSSDVLVWTYHLQFCNFGASAAPGVGNDNTENYIAGSIWSDTTHHNVYVCTDNSTGAAVWQQVTSGGSSYTFADSLVNTAGTVTLVNDSASPSASQYYGTDSGSTLGYHNLPAASPHNLLDGSVDQDTVAQAAVKGTLIVGNATPAWDGLAVGTDGNALMADSTQTLGVKWVSLSSVYQPLNSYLTTISGGTDPFAANYDAAGAAATAQSNAETYATSQGYITTPVGVSLSSGDIWVGSASNVAAAVAMGGDATLDHTVRLTLASVASAGTYGQVTVNVKGLVTSGGTCDTGHGGFGTDVSGYNGVPVFTGGVVSDLTNTRGVGPNLQVNVGVDRWIGFGSRDS